MSEDKYIQDKYAPLWVKIMRSFISVYLHIFRPKIPTVYHYYIRDNYFARFYQFRFFWSDYISKKQYKEIHYRGEFGPELLFALPFAYWHHCNGTLKKTIGCRYTSSLYFFSPDHEEAYTERIWRGTHDYRLPNVAHGESYDFSKWKQVPLKKQYQNDIIVFDKPTLIIANRYNVEWGNDPVSYFDIPVLDAIIKKFKKDFTIIYNRPKPNVIVEDNSEIKDLNEFDWMRREHPEVVFVDDLYEKYKSYTHDFNHFQLMVYANSSRFISVHGGTSVLASYFGGTNIILSKKGIEHYFHEFENIYPRLSGAQIIHVKTYPELIAATENLV